MRVRTGDEIGVRRCKRSSVKLRFTLINKTDGGRECRNERADLGHDSIGWHGELKQGNRSGEDLRYEGILLEEDRFATSIAAFRSSASSTPWWKAM